MRLPAWLKTKRQRRVGNTVEVTLELDPCRTELARRIAELGRAAGTPMATMLAGAGAMQTMIRAAAEAEKGMSKLAATMSASMTEDMLAMVHRAARRREVRQAGLEARYYVRGGMDPLYATPEARDRYVRTTCRAFRGEGPLAAAAFLRGWVEHHPDPEPPACACWPTPESMHYVYYGATEPGSAWEWNPDCPVHLATRQPVEGAPDWELAYFREDDTIHFHMGP